MEKIQMPEQSTFFTHTLRHHPRGEAIVRILDAAIRAVEPGTAVRRFVQRAPTSLLINKREYRFQPRGRIVILGVGKAAHAMTAALVEILDGLDYDGLIIPKHTPPTPLPGLEIQPGGHPIPDGNSLAAGQKVLRRISELTQNDLVICLISGGGSALMTAPHPGIALADLQSLTSTLLVCGARIDEINTLRRHLDLLKGGGLAKHAFPAQVVSLILSDVVHNPLEAIASGPTSPDPSSRKAALDVLKKYDVRHTVPAAILSTLETAPETPKPDDHLFERVQNVLIGSSQIASEAGLLQARAEGFTARTLGSDWQGEASLAAKKLCAVLTIVPDQPPFCLAAGGETTVTVRGNGRGGRNQELALASVESLAERSNLLITLATDGEDGPTDAAGAVVSGETLGRGQTLGMHPQSFLDSNNAYTYFNALDDLIKIGPTGTNVNDLTFLFGF